MIYLVTAILLNVLISALFKLFPRYDIDTFQAVVTNYIVCVVTGCVFVGHIPVDTGSTHLAWFPWSLLAGVMFISIFTLLGQSIKIDGITTTIIANKLSLVIPALFSVLLYHELVGLGKIAGILLAFPAIYLTTRIKGENNKPQNLLLPVLIFLGGGLLDTLMKYVQATYLGTAAEQAQFAIFTFAVAGGIGFAVVAVLLLLKKTTFRWQNIVAGIVIGIPNYFSIYFLIRMLNSNFLQSSAIIPVFNISIVVVSSLTAVLLFSEPVNRQRIIGLCLSVLAILLIAFGDR